MSDLPADPAALRAAMRDDLARTLILSTEEGDTCDCVDDDTCEHPVPTLNLSRIGMDGPCGVEGDVTAIANVVLARLSDRYDLDGWLAHLAAERAEEVRG